MVGIKKPTKDGHWLPSGNPIVFTFSTTNTYTRLSYIINVYINGVLACKLKYPVYDRQRLDVDLRSVVNDFLKDDFVNDNTVSIYSELIYPKKETCSLYIEVEEEYWDGSSMVNPGVVNSTKEIFIWRAAATFQDARTVWKYEDDFTFDLNTHYRADFPKFLGAKLEPFDNANEVELVLNTTANPAFFRHCYKVSMQTVRTLSFFTYGYTNAPIGSISDVFSCWCYDKDFRCTKKMEWFNPDYTNYVFSDYAKKISQFPCTPPGLNSMPWDNQTLYTGTSNNVDVREDKFYVIFSHEGNDKFGEWGIRAIPFELVPCNQYDTYDILYKTREGGWWQIRADRKSQKSTEVKTSVKLNTWGIGANQPVPNDWRSKEVMHTEANGTITLNTDWLDCQAFIDEVEDMIVSPSIYLIKEGITPVYIPVLLKDTTTRIYNKNQDKLIQYSFEFEEAYKKATLI